LSVSQHCLEERYCNLNFGKKEKKMRRILLGIMALVTFSILSLALYSNNAQAIPVLARKYSTSCATCHAPFPRLNATGEAIRLNGYKMPEGDEVYVKIEPVSMGAEAYKKVFPEAIWPSDIPYLPPISILVEGEVDVDAGGTKDSRTSFVFPKELAILSLGSFGENFSFFAELEFEEEEGEDLETEIAAWLMWEDLFSGALGENHLNIKAGKVGIQEIALPNNRGHNRITAENYLHEQELDLHSQPGFEVNGFGQRWRYSLGIVDADSDNSEKDFYGALAFKIGGLGFDGSGGASEEGGLKTSPSGYWRDDSVRFGVFAYRTYLGDDGNDEFTRIGGDIRLNYKDLSVAGGYIAGDDDSETIDQDLWFAEAEYWIYPWVVTYVRYEALSVDGADDEDQARLIPGAAFLIRANIKLTVEGRLYTENEPAKEAGGEGDDDRVVFQLTWSG
jgi:hypothetical protein